MSELDTISWIGCGKVGRTLARALSDAGYKIGAIYCRQPESARAALDLIGVGEVVTDLAAAVDSARVHFVVTNDDSISEVAGQIDRQGPPSLENHYFFHTSGSISSTVFEGLQKKGAEIASIHPLQVFADPVKALETLPGIYYAIEGTDRAMTLAIQMVDRLKGKLLLIPTGRKVLYHIAGVFVSNYLTVLVKLALNIMEDIGEIPEESYDAFLPLMVGALQNIEALGISEALTGPIARGDLDTVRKHLQALERLRPEILRAYKVLGQEAVEIAAQGGRISTEKAKQLLEMLHE